MRWISIAALLVAVGCAGESPCEEWYCEDGSGNGTTTGKDGTGKDGTGKDGTGKTAGLSMGASLDATTGTGEVWLTDGSCESFFDHTAIAAGGCASCELAFTLDLTAVQPGGDCPDQDAFLGPLGLGHQAPDLLWIEKEGSWYVYDDATSGVSGDTWDFEFAF